MEVKANIEFKNLHGRVIVPGSLEFIVSSDVYTIDFLDFSGIYDKKNPNILHCFFYNEDTESFPGIKEFVNHIHEISSLGEFHIEYDENDTNEAVSLLSYEIEESFRADDPILSKLKSNDNMEIVKEEFGTMTKVTYRLKDKLLGTVKFI